MPQCLLGDAGVGSHCLTGYSVLLDDKFLCAHAFLVAGVVCVVPVDVCWGVLVGLVGMASGCS